ncbi:unnamed protein product [Pieris macdunnoughi]|uniref:Uncharacterized protein n=1 Tax=Pieris macdunnoughi TaxID=345717 RepID=A0A821UWP2_9NEOP|nr:unnamed protein product [Pieris macdunnoughi]
MDDTLGFSEQEKKPSDDWHPGDTEESVSSVTSKICPHYQDLQVLQKNDFFLDRPQIPATYWERLSFFRSYATSQTRTMFLCVQEEDFRVYLWNYLINVFFKSLPSTYVYAFLSAYVPDTHFFVAKIFPIAYGSTLAFIITAFIDLIMVTYSTTKYLDYLVLGFRYQSPWNRCSESFNITYKNTTLKCYEIQDFAKQFINKSVIFDDIVYISEENEHFQLPQLLFYLSRMKYFQNCNVVLTCSYFVIFWLGATITYPMFFKRFLWKTLHIAQMGLNMFLIIVFVHLTIIYFERGYKKYPVYRKELLDILQSSDFDLLSESMTTPPIVHILSSRSNIDKKPIQDSALIVTSNAVYYTFRGFVTYLLKLYCDNLANTSLQAIYFSSESLFYLWPIYFSQFYLGNLFTIVFFLLNLINEYLVIVITVHCLIEAILCEWRWLNTWILIVSLSVLGVATFHFIPTELIEIMYILCTALMTLMELIIIFYLYPLGRLVDDMTFFNGVRPTKLRIFTFWAAPVFYMLKIYYMITGLFKIVALTTLPQKYLYQYIYIPAVPMFFGALFAFFKYVIVKKMVTKNNQNMNLFKIISV